MNKYIADKIAGLQSLGRNRSIKSGLSVLLEEQYSAFITGQGVGMEVVTLKMPLMTCSGY